MKITDNFKKAATEYMKIDPTASVIVTKTRKWNTDALVNLGSLEYLIKLENGTEIKSGYWGEFRKKNDNEIKYMDLMTYAK